MGCRRAGGGEEKNKCGGEGMVGFGEGRGVEGSGEQEGQPHKDLDRN